MSNAQVAQQESQQQQIPVVVQQQAQSPMQQTSFPPQQLQYPVQQQMQFPIQQQMMYAPQQLLSNNMQSTAPIVVPISNSNRAGYYGSRPTQTRQGQGRV
jgi:hypothetical protein